MGKLSRDMRRACSLQAMVFEASVTNSDSGSAVFVRRFMLSDVARRFDSGFVPIEPQDAGALVREVEGQYGNKVYGSARYTANELHWMGYVYRAWSCMLDMPSKTVYRQIGAADLRACYGPYHTLDVEQAVARIREDRNLNNDVLSIEYGVKVMRRIRELEEDGC